MTTTKTRGQIAYELDVLARPNYDDDTPRPPWEKICAIAKVSWERNPTQRFVQKES